MNGNQVVLELIVFGARGLVGSLMFTSPQLISIGRDPHSMVHLDDASVSLRHAEVALNGDSVVITDLGSRTGTRVNGKDIEGDHALRATDEINIGPFRLRQTIHRSAKAETGQTGGRGRKLSVPTPYDPTHPATAIAGGAGRKSTAKSPAKPEEEESTVVRGIADDIRRSLAQQPPSEPPAVRTAKREPEPSHPLRHGMETRPSLDELDKLLDSALEEQPPPERGARHADDRDDETLEAHVEGPVAFDESTGPTNKIVRPAEARAARVEPQTARSLEPRPARTVEPEPARSVEPALAHGNAVHRNEEASEDDDDDEDDDTDFVPPFDLLEVLSRGAAGVDTPSAPVTVEVARFRDDRVIWIHHLTGGKSLRVAESASPLGECMADGSFVFFPAACGSFSVRKGVRHLTTEERAALGREPRVKLTPGMEVLVELEGGDGLMLHLVARAAALAPNRPGLRPVLDRVIQGACSLAVHVLVVIVIGLTIFGGKSSAAADVNAGRFATIKVPEVEVEPPPPPPPPPEPVQADSALVKPAPNQPPLPSSSKHPTKSTAQPTDSQPASDQPSASAQKILKALGGAPAGPDLGALNNLDSVPRGGSSGFKVSDAVGKAPGEALRLGGGGGEVNTKSASEIGNAVGRVQVKSSNVVRARVTAPPAAVRVEGHLDRGEIQKVVNAHLFQVQGCYERQLAKNPSLSGKIAFRWVITPTGSVGSTRVAQSSIQSVEVASCIQSAIQGWTFPAPEGGSVTVTYPFAFTTFGN